MPLEAATSTGGAEGAARKPAQQQSTTGQFAGNGGDKPASVQDRIRASLFTSDEPAPDADRRQPQQRQAEDTGSDDEGGQQRQASQDANEDQQGQQAQATQEQQVDESASNENADAGAQDDDQEQSIHSLTELAEGLGWDLDRVLDLDVSTKIGGKDGKAKLRDIVKSHQLEGHLNQGLMKLAEERKAFEAETTRKVSEFSARVGQLNQAIGMAQKILDGEFADVNWQELQRTDPAAFQAKYGAYKMRLDGIQQLAQMTSQESERDKAAQATAHETYRTEQAQLLSSKIPEWNDAKRREKDVAELAAILNDSYGITKDELMSVVDHRQILLARDAAAWRKLQKSKPATLNKVRTAPRLIRPGAQQSRAAQDGLEVQKGRENLRRSGRVQDATPLLKKLIF